MPRVKYRFSVLLLAFLGTINEGVALERLTVENWNASNAKHLLERTGFGSTPEEIHQFSQLSLKDAVDLIVDGPKNRSKKFDDFVHSGVFDVGLDPFPPSRPATTNLAKKTGAALGIKVRPDGNRPLQPIVDKFFYWLRASRLETDRVTQWWGQRMLFQTIPYRKKWLFFGTDTLQRMKTK